MGGEITYRCLGNNQYEISLTIYRDCAGSGAAFDNVARIGIFNANTGISVRTLNVPLPGFSVVPINTVSGCLTVPPGICIEKAVYIDTVTLPPSADGYDLVYQRCCRNGTITNLTNPGSQGSTYTTFIPDSTLVCNNSPVFTNFPPIVLCNNDPLTFDHSATDADGDSLVYQFIAPFVGGTQFNPLPTPVSPPFSTVNWAPGFSFTNPVTSVPGLVIDPVTGMITGTPRAVGQFVVGIAVREYRNGVLINTTLRDFQFNVVACQNSRSAIFDPGVICNSFTVNFLNTSINATSYFWNFGDPTTTADISTATNPQYTYPDTGVYTVMLISDPNSTICSDTVFLDVRVFPLISPQFTVPPSQCLNGNSYNFSAAGAYFPTTRIEWVFGPTTVTSSLDSMNPTGIVFNASGKQAVGLRYRDFGCDTTYVDSVEVLVSPDADFFISPNNCVDFNIQFNDRTTNGGTYLWNFGSPSSNPNSSTVRNPLFNFPDSGTYNVRLIATNANTCADTTSQIFRVLPKLRATFARPASQCFAGNSFQFSAGGSLYNSTIVNWDLGINTAPQFSNSRNPSNVTYSAPGFQQVTLTYSDFGCIKTFTDSVFLSVTPIADFSLVQNEFCIGDSIPVAFTNLSQSGLIYSWDFGDGKGSTLENPTNVYQSIGTFDIAFTVSDTVGCFDTELKPSLITILPSPFADFSPRDTTISSLFPHLTFVSKAQNDFTSVFTTGNGDTFNPFVREEYTYNADGYFYPKLVVSNPVGCTDTAEGRVYVEPEFPVYIPNSFTPNDDGLNDIFKPVLLESISYNFMVFNKWGELVFQTNDVEEGWDGKYKTGEYLAPEVYVYRVEYSSPKKLDQIHQGHITLIR